MDLVVQRDSMHLLIVSPCFIKSIIVVIKITTTFPLDIPYFIMIDPLLLNLFIHRKMK